MCRYVNVWMKIMGRALVILYSISGVALLYFISLFSKKMPVSNDRHEINVQLLYLTFFILIYFGGMFGLFNWMFYTMPSQTLSLSPDASAVGTYFFALGYRSFDL